MAWLFVGLSAFASPVDPPSGESWDAVMRMLSSRDPVPCATIEALTPDPTATLLAVVDTVERPPWAPMRAANCLIQNHATEAQSAIERWVVAPELKGLGRLVLSSLDAMPLSVAVPVARKALAEGADPVLARERISAAKSAEIRALAVTP